jgi:hypothetical protein
VASLEARLLAEHRQLDVRRFDNLLKADLEQRCP